MHFQLKKPELQRFIDEQVKSGRFPSADAAIESAVEKMMLEDEIELDDETVAAINRAEEQIDRGEGIDFKEFAREMRKKFAAR
jgi:Arc/MetJ-type ribon-helix-helix transcriptional regulator